MRAKKESKTRGGERVINMVVWWVWGKGAY